MTAQEPAQRRIVDVLADLDSVRARQRAMASSWQGTGTGTEQLRTALRDYRNFWHQVQRLDLGEKTGA